MLNLLLNALYALPLLALAWGAWHLLGRAAQRLGTGRWQVLGLAGLLSLLAGR